MISSTMTEAKATSRREGGFVGPSSRFFPACLAPFRRVAESVATESLCKVSFFFLLFSLVPVIAVPDLLLC